MAGLLPAVMALPAIAEAAVKAGPNMAGPGHHRLRDGAAAVPPPLDGLPTPAAAYSLRKLRSAYAGPAIKLRRATGGTQDINFLGFVPGLGGPLDVAAANVFCASTSCFADTWYDQSGNGRHAVMATTADQPSFVFDCKGSLPCVRGTGSQGIGAAGVSPAGAQSFATVARADSTTGCIWMAAGNNRLVTGWQIDNSAVGVSLAVPAAMWHAGNGVVNAAATVINVDGVEATGTVAVDGTVGNLYFLFGGSAGQCSEVEGIWWNGYALTAPERAALLATQRSFWGTP